MFIDVLIEHDADESACFVLRDDEKYAKVVGDGLLPEAFEVSDIVSYATLPVMIERWGIPVGPKARQRLDIRRPESVRVWDVARIFSFLSANESPKVPIQRADAQHLASGKFTVLKVVTFTQLQDIKHEDIRKALKTVKFSPASELSREVIIYT